MMQYAVRLTETAKQDLRQIAFYLAEQERNRESAKQFIQELKTQCARLAEFPYSGALPKDHVLLSMGYRFLTHKSYFIFYAVDENEKAVHILAVFNARQDYFCAR